MKLSIVVSACVTLTACGANDAAFVERSFGVVADVGGKESGGSEVDAGRAGTGGSEGPESGTSGTGGATEAAGNRATSGERSEAGQITPVTDSVVSLGEEPVGSEDGRTGVPEGPVAGGGGIPAPTPAPVPDTPPGNVDESRNLPAQCKSMGGPGTRIHIVSSNARIVSPEATVIVAHVNGNRGRLMLTLGGQRGYKGLCLLVNGNQGSADIAVETTVGAIVYAGHGNQSAGNVFISNAGSVRRANVTLAGGGARLVVDAVQTGDCGAWTAGKVKGKGSSFTCY